MVAFNAACVLLSTAAVAVHWSCWLAPDDDDDADAAAAATAAATAGAALSAAEPAQTTQQNVGAALAASATLLLWLRLLRVLYFSRRFGIILLAATQMVYDVVYVTVLMAIIALAFGLALAVLLRNDPSLAADCGAYRTYKLLLVADMFHENYGGEPLFSCFDDDARIMPTLAYAIHLVFILAELVLMLNLLIGLMAKRFDVIWDSLGPQGTFARTTLLLEAVDLSPMPPPLNLLSVPYRALQAAGVLRDCCRRRGETPSRAEELQLQRAHSLAPPSPGASMAAEWWAGAGARADAKALYGLARPGDDTASEVATLRDDVMRELKALRAALEARPPS